MSIKILVRDGNPWWESPDIWVVPGTDPSGSPGTPVVGQTAYLWATVSNTGDEDAGGVQVDFWVADPSAQIRKSTAQHIGTSFADVPAGGSQDVLCLSPWSVQLFNNGHECVVVEALDPADPLQPAPTDPDLLDPPTYRQIAQRNLNVVMAGPKKRMEHAIGVRAGRRTGKLVTVDAEVGGELPAVLLERLGLRVRRPASARAVRVGLARETMCGSDHQGTEKLELEVAAGTSVPVYVGIQAEEIAPDEYCLVRVIEREHGEVRGGVSFVVVHESHGGRNKS